MLFGRNIVPEINDSLCPTGYQKRTVQILRVLHVYSKALEITRLDLTMQPLIQPILPQIIDSSFYFPERFRDFSTESPQELQLLHLKTSYHLYRIFG